MGLALLILASCSKDEMKSAEKSILDFSFSLNGKPVKGAVDNAKMAVSLTVPYGTDVTAIAPAVVTSPLSTVLPASGAAQDFTKPVTYTVTAEDGSKQAYTVTITIEKSTECLIKEFKFTQFSPNVVAVIDQNTKTISAKVPFGTDLTALTPFIQISSDATISPEANKPTNFTSPVEYTVTSQNGETSKYTVTVVTDEDPSVLRIISLNKTSFIVGLGEIVITGRNLKKEGTTSYVLFGTTKVKGVVNEAGTEITAGIPTTLTPGKVMVKVQVGINNNSNEMEVTIMENTFPKPTISSVTPSEVVSGDIIEITGSNFMKSGNTVRLATSGYPALNYVLTPVEESETRLRFSTAGISKPASFDLYVKSNGKEEKHTAKVKLTLKPAVIASVSPLKVKAGETITITGENFNKETLSMVLIDNGAHAITYVDDKHVTIKASTDLKPGKYLLEIKIGATSPSGGPTFKVIYSTEIEIIA